MLSFHMFARTARPERIQRGEPRSAKLQPRSERPSALSPRPLVHSRHSTPLTSNGFRTPLRNRRTSTPFLSIACGLFPSQWGCTPLALFSSTAPCSFSSVSHRPSHFVSTACNMPLSQLFCFDNHPFSWGVYTPHFYFLRRPRNSIPSIFPSRPAANASWKMW
jgi:hypothetical protein